MRVREQQPARSEAEKNQEQTEELEAQHQSYPTIGTSFAPTSPPDPPLDLRTIRRFAQHNQSARQNVILRMQQTQGNLAVQRFLNQPFRFSRVQRQTQPRERANPQPSRETALATEWARYVQTPQVAATSERPAARGQQNQPAPIPTEISAIENQARTPENRPAMRAAMNTAITPLLADLEQHVRASWDVYVQLAYAAATRDWLRGARALNPLRRPGQQGGGPTHRLNRDDPHEAQAREAQETYTRLVARLATEREAANAMVTRLNSGLSRLAAVEPASYTTTLSMLHRSLLAQHSQFRRSFLDETAIYGSVAAQNRSARAASRNGAVAAASPPQNRRARPQPAAPTPAQNQSPDVNDAIAWLLPDETVESDPQRRALQVERARQVLWQRRNARLHQTFSTAQPRQTGQTTGFAPLDALAAEDRTTAEAGTLVDNEQERRLTEIHRLAEQYIVNGLPGGADILRPERQIMTLLRGLQPRTGDLRVTGIGEDLANPINPTIGTYPNHGIGSYDIMVGSGHRIMLRAPASINLNEQMTQAEQRPTGANLYQYVGSSVSFVNRSSMAQEFLGKVAEGYFSRNYHTRLRGLLTRLSQQFSTYQPQLRQYQERIITAADAARVYLEITQNRARHPEITDAILQDHPRQIGDRNASNFLSGLLYTRTVRPREAGEDVPVAGRQALWDVFVAQVWPQVQREFPGLGAANSVIQPVDASQGSVTWSQAIPRAIRVANRGLVARIQSLTQQALGSNAQLRAAVETHIRSSIQPRAQSGAAAPASPGGAGAQAEANNEANPLHLGDRAGATVAVLHHYQTRGATPQHLYTTVHYSHLHRIAPGLTTGAADSLNVREGNHLLGVSGTSGNADEPHVHININFHRRANRGQAGPTIGVLNPTDFYGVEMGRRTRNRP